MTVSPTPDYSTQAAPDLSLAATPWREDLANALQICDAMAQTYTAHRNDALNDAGSAFFGVARLLRDALAKLDGREAAHPQEHTQLKEQS